MNAWDYLEGQLKAFGLAAELLAPLSTAQLRRMYDEALDEVLVAAAAHRPRDFAPLIARWSLEPPPPGMWFCRGARCKGLGYPATRDVPHPVTCLDATWTWPGPASLPRHNDDGPPPVESFTDRLLLQAENQQSLSDLANRVEDKLQAAVPELSGLIGGLMTAARVLVGLPPSRRTWELLLRDDERRQLLQLLDARTRQLGGTVDRQLESLERQRRLEALLKQVRARTHHTLLLLFQRDNERRRLLQLLAARARPI